ncbi:hypothetical protein A3C87_00655 [Candidatus Kaiserbacteria bacterium RIFCSPHIGHO2_02_FULL_49_34]|uniref:LytR/CpsA/Psr regulator C-terminal domain-containing protein n=1 Tax=Candidatus Kaiserbacteria bacterium RIFCSPHIGHO2_02_FULL_49_34 TaxID=1798491 RepID=A0A1F6DLL0_9BACT|nr:MAG: hypothetical protein A3C87_00655 [Candidatus Kaiserbacteria bacterium RIFCSPHIGHO2_02_FULL_49_34]
MHTRPFYTTQTFYIVMTTTFVLVLALIFTTTTRDLRAIIEQTFVAETGTVQTLTVENEHYLALKAKLSLPDIAQREAPITPDEAQGAATSTEEAISTTAPTLNLLDYSLAVRNGTTIQGHAGNLATLLEGAGFAKAATGNASPQTVTEIYINADIRTEVFALLKAAAPELLAEAQLMQNNPTSADIVIILGSN